MNIIRFPNKEDYAKICERPHMDVSQLNNIVNGVLSDIRENGDKAVIAYEEKFDKVKLSTLAVTDEEIAEAENLVDEELKKALVLAHDNIAKFHESQKF